jgi:predicted HicB family RNase H-like nuclease
MRKKTQEARERMIHIRLSGEVHRRLRIRAAELDTTIQDWVSETVARELDRQEKRKTSGS